MNSNAQSTCPACGGTGRKVLGPNQWIPCPVCKRSAPPAVKAPTPTSVPPRWPFYLCAIYVLFAFFSRVLTPGGEWPSRTSQVFSIGVDLVAFISLIASRVIIACQPLPRLAESIFGAMLVWLALAAGLGLLLLRFHSNASWWTGHLH